MLSSQCSSLLILAGFTWAGYTAAALVENGHGRRSLCGASPPSPPGESMGAYDIGLGHGAGNISHWGTTEELANTRGLDIEGSPEYIGVAHDVKLRRLGSLKFRRLHDPSQVIPIGSLPFQ